MSTAWIASLFPYCESFSSTREKSLMYGTQMYRTLYFVFFGSQYPSQRDTSHQSISSSWALVYGLTFHRLNSPGKPSHFNMITPFSLMYLPATILILALLLLQWATLSASLRSPHHGHHHRHLGASVSHTGSWIGRALVGRQKKSDTVPPPSPRPDKGRSPRLTNYCMSQRVTHIRWEQSSLPSSLCNMFSTRSLHTCTPCPEWSKSTTSPSTAQTCSLTAPRHHASRQLTITSTNASPL
jgi:hypothetical protein